MSEPERGVNQISHFSCTGALCSFQGWSPAVLMKSKQKLACFVLQAMRWPALLLSPNEVVSLHVNYKKTWYLATIIRLYGKSHLLSEHLLVMFNCTLETAWINTKRKKDQHGDEVSFCTWKHPKYHIRFLLCIGWGVIFWTAALLWQVRK